MAVEGKAAHFENGSHLSRINNVVRLSDGSARGSTGTFYHYVSFTLFSFLTFGIRDEVKMTWQCLAVKTLILPFE